MKCIKNRGNGGSLQLSDTCKSLSGLHEAISSIVKIYCARYSQSETLIPRYSTLQASAGMSPATALISRNTGTAFSRTAPSKTI